MSKKGIGLSQMRYDQMIVVCYSIFIMKPKVQKTNFKDKNKEKKQNLKKYKEQQGHTSQQVHFCLHHPKKPNVHEWPVNLFTKINK